MNKENTKCGNVSLLACVLIVHIYLVTVSHMCLTHVSHTCVGPNVVVGLTEVTYTVNEGEQVTLCIQMTAGTISQPLIVTIQPGFSSQSEPTQLATAFQDHCLYVVAKLPPVYDHV